MLTRPFFWVIVSVTLVFAILPLATGDANLRENLIIIAIAIALASNVNLMIGYTGYVNFGNVISYGLGGYIGLYLATVTGWPLIAAAIGAGITVSLFTLVFGLAILRLRGAYFGLATIGILEAVKTFVSNFNPWGRSDADVDAYHSRLHPGAEAASSSTAACKDAGGIAEARAVDDCQRLVQVAGANDCQHRPKNLFLGDCHVRLHIIEDGWAEEKTTLAAGGAAIQHQARSFLQTFLDVGTNAVDGIAAHQRTHSHVFLQAAADAELCRRLPQQRDQFVSCIAHRDDHTARQATLSGCSKSGAHDCVYRQIEVSIGHYQQMVFGAGQSLHALSSRRRFRVDELGHWSGANKRDGADIGML